MDRKRQRRSRGAQRYAGVRGCSSLEVRDERDALGSSLRPSKKGLTFHRQEA